ncbi:MAG: carboxypeptidase regulatory-like domain-containing protein [Gemmatimonadaceae bacterium]|nr:carboxypeptidase regulatory-like domain-containing protein [Gemmatimonadaceae bacterium]
MTNALKRVRMVGCGIVAVLMLSARPLVAQETPRGIVRGTVVDATGRPIENADVFVEQLKQRTRTTAEGRFAFVGVKAGKYTIGARSVGYLSASKKVSVKDSATVLQLVLERGAFSLPARVTTASRGGLSGVVADTGYAPLANVHVRVVGADKEAITDARGAFFVPVEPGRYLVRLEREGYARQLIGVSVPESAGREIAAWMVPQKGRDNPQIGANLFDLRKRLIGAEGNLPRGPATSRLLTREDVDTLGQRDLLQLVRAVAGYPVGADCWVRVNGGPRKDPIWRLSTDDVEFVELYAKGTSRVTSGPVSPGSSRERLAEQRLDQATTPSGSCSAEIIVWTR